MDRQWYIPNHVNAKTNNMKQTAMQQLLAQLKDERANLPMNIEWDRCYQAIEMVIQNTYIAVEREQLIDAWMAEDNELQRLSAEKYYNETYGK
jgi:hypothetical protein